MIALWQLFLVSALSSFFVAAAPQPLVVQSISSGGPSQGNGSTNRSETTVSVNPVSTVQSTVAIPTTSPPTTSSSATAHKKSFALTPHSQESATGFEVGSGQLSTPLAQAPAKGADSATDLPFTSGLSTIAGCFHTETQLISNLYTTTAAIPCVAGSPQDSANINWPSGTNPNSNPGGPGGNIPHSQTTVAGNPNSIFRGGGGRGGNPLPEPESTVAGGDMNSILGGPGKSSPKPTDPPNAPLEPVQTVADPPPIGASPAPAPAPAPIQTTSIAPVQPVSVPSASPVITVGSSTVTADSASHFVIGTQTLAPGGPAITHSGTVLSLPPSGAGVAIGPSTQVVQPAVPTPAITVAGSTVTANSASQFVVGSQTLTPGGPAITHSGTVVSLAPSASAVVIAGKTQDLIPPMATPPPSITIGGQVITANAASQFQIGGQTLKPGAAPIIANGQTLSLARSEPVIVVNGQTQNIARPTPTPLPVITVGGAEITGNSASEYIINGQTLAAGKPPITVSGQVLSIAPSGNAVVFGPSTQAFVTPPMVISTSLPVLTIGALQITADSASNYVIGGQTIHAGGSAITMDGTVVSLAPSATALVIGGSTEALTPSSVLATTEPPLITLGSQILHANAASDYVIGGQTLTPGHAITVSGTVISLAPGASDVVIGGSTEVLTPQLVSLSTGLPVLTIGSTTITADAEGDYVVSGQTIRPGAHAITIGGQLVSLAANDSMLVIGTSTEMLHGVTSTGGAITRSRTRNSEPANSTATAITTGSSIPTLGGPAPAAATTKRSDSARSDSKLWLALSTVSLITIIGLLMT